MIVQSASLPPTPPSASPCGAARGGDVFDLSLARASGNAPAGHDGANPRIGGRQIVADPGRIMPDGDTASGKPTDGEAAKVASQDDIDAGHDMEKPSRPAAIDPAIAMTVSPVTASPLLPMDAAIVDTPAAGAPTRTMSEPVSSPDRPPFASPPQAGVAPKPAETATAQWQAVAFAGDPVTALAAGPVTGNIPAAPPTTRDPAVPVDEQPFAGDALTPPATDTTQARPLTTRDAAMPVDKTPVPAPVPAAATGAIVPASLVGTTAPASQVFAAAITAWSHDETTPGGDDMPSIPLAPGAATPPTLPIAAPGDAQAATLDMRREHRPQGMIDHIERLRDDADAVDTRIRVAPDALGTIDVSVRRDGDTVHVHLAAEQVATRTMLSEAAPQLAELAEQRGLKLGQTMVDAGTTGREQPRREAPATPSPAQRAPTPADATASAETDQRIA